MADIRGFSKKQQTILNWWHPDSPYADREAIICDGAVRSGKTLVMGLSFVLWAFLSFDRQRFALCGRTVESLKRNLLSELLPYLRRAGFTCKVVSSRNRLVIRLGPRENTFLLFGGHNEASAALIQGVTLAGILLDEVALMPRSFVEQALARCSVNGARLWFNCNPDAPSHWFYREWIQDAGARRALCLHFTMEDNPLPFRPRPGAV